MEGIWYLIMFILMVIGFIGFICMIISVFQVYINHDNFFIFPGLISGIIANGTLIIYSLILWI